MAVGKGKERRREMTERIPFADCHAAVGKDFSYFFIIEFLCRLLLLAGGKGFFYFFSKQKFFADWLFWQVAKDSLPTAFIGRWQRALCRLLFLAGGKGLFVDCLFWQMAKLSLFMRFQLCHLLFTWQVAKLE